MCMITLPIDLSYSLEYGIDERRRKILKWLSPDDFEEVHERHVKKRFPNTGQWLLDDPRFISWRDETQSSILWCHGARTL